MEKFCKVVRCYQNAGSIVATIPVNACSATNIQPGDSIAVFVDGNERIVFVPLKESENLKLVAVGEKSSANVPTKGKNSPTTPAPVQDDIKHSERGGDWVE